MKKISKISSAVVRALSKPNIDDHRVAAVAPKPACSTVSSPRSSRSPHHDTGKSGQNGPALVTASLAFLWFLSVATLTRFCLLELNALKKEIFLALDDSTSSSLAALYGVGNGAGGEGEEHGGSAVGNRNLATLVAVFPDVSAGDNGSVLLPRLIIHVGPSKSATTTLQTDLTAACDAGWLTSEYAGRFYRPFYRTAAAAAVLAKNAAHHHHNKALKLNRSESPLLVTARQMLSASYCARPGPWCCTAFRNELDTYCKNSSDDDDDNINNINKKATAVILSDEAFGNMWTDPAHFAAIHQALSTQWNVTVAVGYRHFYEWILSAKYQRDRTDRISNHGKVLWPGPGPDGGRALLPLFPDTLSNWRTWFHYTDTIVYNAKHGSIDDVRILDLHATTTETTNSPSLLTQFLCAAHLEEDCATSRRVDLQKSGAPMTVMNSQANTTVPSLYYDAVATRAGEQNLVDTTVHDRRRVREAVRAFHEDTHGLTPHDLPLHCPTETELTQLLECSLQMERAFFVVPNQQEHIDGFWSKARANAFCWVNATAVLHSQHWRDFFAESY